MPRQPDFEIADIADLKPTRGSNRGNIERDIPIYEEKYAKLNINTTSVSNPRSNLPVNVTNDLIKTLKHWLRDSDYADFAQCTNVNASASNARAISKATTKRNGRGWKETNGAEIKVFIGILLYMGVHPIGFTECAAYWSRSPRTPFHPVVFNAMGYTRFY
jgi:post-segregation antitoxin (ccd killing protein)